MNNIPGIVTKSGTVHIERAVVVTGPNSWYHTVTLQQEVHRLK